MNGTGREVSIASNVPGAEIYVQRKYVGKAPLIVRISHGRDKVIEARKPGYFPARGVLTTSFNSDTLWYPVIVPQIVDAITGAMFTLDDCCVRLDLHPIPSTSRMGRPANPSSAPAKRDEDDDDEDEEDAP